jgi:hypothetical protein
MTTIKKSVSRKVYARPAAHNVSANLCVTVHPGGTISIRESGRRESSAVYLDISQLYVQGVRQKMRQEKMNKKKARLSKKA